MSYKSNKQKNTYLTYSLYDEPVIHSDYDEIINDILTDISNEVDKNSEPIIREIISDYKLDNSIDEIIGGMTINDNNDIYEKYIQIYYYDIRNNNKIILFLLIILLIILLYIIYKILNKQLHNIN